VTLDEVVGVAHQAEDHFLIIYYVINRVNGLAGYGLAG
jgi:hypothetical protein